MRFYWSTASIPELEGYSLTRRRIIFREAARLAMKRWWMWLLPMPVAFATSFTQPFAMAHDWTLWHRLALVLVLAVLQNHINIWLVRRHILEHMDDAHDRALRRSRPLRRFARDTRRRRVVAGGAPVARPKVPALRRPHP